jgi:Ankyrin repeat
MEFAGFEDIFEQWNALTPESCDLYEKAIDIVTKNSENTETDASALHDLFVSNPDLNVNFNGLKSIYGNSLLYEAVSCGHVLLVETLLKLGADPRAENHMDGETPLQWVEEYEAPLPEHIKKIHQLLLGTGEALARQKCKVIDTSPQAVLKQMEHDMWWAMGEDRKKFVRYEKSKSMIRWILLVACF